MLLKGRRFSVKKTRKSLPDLGVQELAELVINIVDYVDVVRGGCDYECGVIDNVDITLNAAVDKNYCAQQVGSNKVEVHVSYKYSPPVRQWLLAHELTHALYPICDKQHHMYNRMFHDYRPQEMLANSVARRITGLGYTEIIELIRKEL